MSGNHPGQLAGGCPTLKPRYANEERARRAAIVASKRPGVPELSFYLCGECSGYHLTRSVGGDNPRVAKKPRGPRNQ